MSFYVLNKKKNDFPALFIYLEVSASLTAASFLLLTEENTIFKKNSMVCLMDVTVGYV